MPIKKIVISLGVMALTLCAQPSSYPLLAPPPPPIQVGTTSIVGNVGNQTYYYFIVARYPIGNSVRSTAIIALNAPATLTATNYVRISWNAVGGATGYDVVRLLTPNFPANGICTNCLVVSNGSPNSPTFNDISNTTLGDYTATSAAAAAFNQYLDNLTQSTPTLIIDASQNSTYLFSSRIAMDASGARTTKPAKVGTVVPLACSTGEMFFQSSATPGSQLYLCGPDNTQTQLNLVGVGTVTSVGTLSPLFTTANATTTPTFSLISQNQNLFFASPNGAPGVASFRAIVAADLPAGTGTVTSVQILGTANQLTATACGPSTTTLTCTLSIPSDFRIPGTLNLITFTQPAAGATLTLANNSTLATVGAFTATFTFTAGTAVTFPTSGTLATTAGLGAYLPLAGGTMVGNIIFTDNTYDIGASGATRPRTGYFGTSLISPLVNGLTITNNGTNTLNIAAGKTLAVNNNLTFAGTDGSTLNMGAGGTLPTISNIVVAVSPGLGIGHFSGATQTLTSSLIVSADLNITTTTCTNQFLTAISATGVGTCTTATLASAQFANQGTTTTVLHGNGAGNPSFGAVVMTTDISGITPIANGGTNCSSASITCFNNITGFSAAGTTGTTTTNLVFSASPTFTVQILAPDGTSSLPGISFSAEGTTGFRRRNAGTVDLYLNSTTRFIRFAGATAVGADVNAGLGSFGLAAGTPETNAADTIWCRSSAGIWEASTSTTCNASGSILAVNTTLTGFLSTGTSPPTCTAGTGGAWCANEGTAPTAATGVDQIYADSTAHDFKILVNNGGAKLLESVAPSPIHSTGNTAAITTATLCAASAGACLPSGVYKVDWAFTQTGTACGTPGTGGVTFLLTWTDSNATAHSAISLAMDDSSSLVATSSTFTFRTTNAAAWASGSFIISSNGSILQYATGYTACSVGTGTYTLDAQVTRIQ